MKAKDWTPPPETAIASHVSGALIPIAELRVAVRDAVAERSVRVVGT